MYCQYDGNNSMSVNLMNKMLISKIFFLFKMCTNTDYIFAKTGCVKTHIYLNNNMPDESVVLMTGLYIYHFDT